jgi:uncharacterized membrane protein
MNDAHLHLLVNHLPVIGTLFSIALLLWALIRKSPELTRVALGFFVLAAISGLAAFYTGEPAEHVVEHMAGISEPILEEHEETAELATILLGVYGLFALGSLIYFRKRREIGRGFTSVAFVLSLIPMGFMAYTAYLGGEVRHPEIRPGANISALQSGAETGTVGEARGGEAGERDER